MKTTVLGVTAPGTAPRFVSAPLMLGMLSTPSMAVVPVYVLAVVLLRTNVCGPKTVRPYVPLIGLVITFGVVPPE